MVLFFFATYRGSNFLVLACNANNEASGDERERTARATANAAATNLPIRRRGAFPNEAY